MRVLIIAQPRTGSTIFSKWLSKELSLLWLDEPFNRQTSIAIDQFFNSDNIVAKVIFEEKKGEWFYDKRIKKNDDVLSLNWDYIFVLTRLNIKDQAISKIWANQNQCWSETKYKIDEEWINKRDRIIQKQIIKFEEDKKIIDCINAYKLTYEEIYESKSIINDIKNIFNIDSFEHLDDLSKENRYRKFNDYNGEDLFDNFKKKSYIRVL